MNSKLLTLADAFLIAIADGYSPAPGPPPKPKSSTEIALEQAANRAKEEYLRKHPTPSTDPDDVYKEKELQLSHERELRKNKLHPELQHTYQGKSATQLVNKFYKILTATTNPFEFIKRKKHYLLPSPLTKKDIELLEILKEYPDTAGRSRKSDEEDYQPLIARGLVERLIEVHPMGHNIYVYVITDAGLDAIDKYWEHQNIKHKIIDNNSASDTNSTFIIEIVTVDPKLSKTALFSFIHQLRSSNYRAMIKYVQERRNDNSILIAFKEPVSRETVLAMCNELPLSFSRYDYDDEEKLIVTDIDVESYLIHSTKEALRFTIEALSADEASALAKGLKMFQRIQDAQTHGNVIQVTFKESASKHILREMCEKLSRTYVHIDPDTLQFRD